MDTEYGVKNGSDKPDHLANLIELTKRYKRIGEATVKIVGGALAIFEGIQSLRQEFRPVTNSEVTD